MWVVVGREVWVVVWLVVGVWGDGVAGGGVCGVRLGYNTAPFPPNSVVGEGKQGMYPQGVCR